MKRFGTCVLVMLLGLPCFAQQTHSPKGTDHFAAVNRRGDRAMGFDHSKTTHHFRLYQDGGAIGVETNDLKDTPSREAIRQHLRSIRAMFAKGDFNLPMFIHATPPPGMPTMKRLRKQITYTYETTPQGAQVRLRTRNRRARVAIHKFLRFQIQDHRTGDPLTVQRAGDMSR
jgi:hypothetical protein